jgi:hypothetical protein
LDVKEFAVSTIVPYSATRESSASPVGDVGFSFARGLWDAAGAVLQGPHAREDMPHKIRHVNRLKFENTAIYAPSY